ncbi:hypothetical protein EM308_09210 [Flavobacterium gilvum]|uniref:RiboL-PSP-HEPN domain-containing protein n=2 Tax=Flavobacterium gilvum TaxID=1492737 RepID=A0AAC9I4X0_9FLAO|nr:hypothetical protein EM308_09210 [Flavobacterium gilvum]KFC60805.1 hypothetical protein FEM08_04170 [Flavobacterium gilvum]
MIDQARNIKISLIKKRSKPNFIIWMLFSTFSVVFYFIHPIFCLNENQILYLFSAASQVIAAIYGLIITGYIFLRNELDRKAEKDETFEEIIQLLRANYFESIVNISTITILSILLCFLVILIETSNHFILINVLINISTATIITELILIVSFVIKILNPKSFEIASEELRKLTTKNKTNEKGSLENFLKNYNQIEQILDQYNTGLNYYGNIRRKKITQTKLANILYDEDKINLSLRNNLIELISFRNNLIHGTNLFVSKDDEELSEQTLNSLKAKVNVP